MSQSSFIQNIDEAIGRPPRVHGGQPNTDDLREYFRSLRDNPNGALAAYQEYVRAFAIHIETATRGRRIDVVWPGGTCDRWSEVEARPADRQHRRMIDCEGYAFLARQLLSEAGWIFIGYEVAYLPTQSDPEDCHIMAVLESPGSPVRRVYIGSHRISSSWLSEARSVWPGDAQNARTVGPARTAQEGIDRVQRQIESGAAREIAPLSGRRSFSPQPFGE